MQFLEQLMEIIGVSLNAIIASSRTQALLEESQRLATELQDKSGELQAQQRELQQSNAELEEKASLLAQQNRAIEIKNLEIEDARRALEDRAEQLALSSRYKSEFLANMSHELRTPLNSLLILAKLLGDNADGNLSRRQVEFAQTIHSSGTDLLQLINDILDLSKVEAGKMDVHPATVAVSGVVEYVEATFSPLTAEKDLRFSVSVSDEVPPTLVSDQHRLQQVLRNLLSNAVKFTASGEVKLVIRTSAEEQFNTPALTVADGVLAFEVTDTGIGIPPEQLRTIFEAFQQADGTISRKFGGTGLGLSISREIARLIGGEIHVESEPGHGSKFTLYLPRDYHGSVRQSSLASGADQAAVRPPVAPAELERVPEQMEDDDGDIVPGDRILLVALADSGLCTAALEVGRSHGFKVLATRYADRALVIAEQRHPDGMVVGMDMASHDGTALHDVLKRNPRTRDIPMVAVHTSVAASHRPAGQAGRLPGRGRGAVHQGEGRRRTRAPGVVHRARQETAAGRDGRQRQPECRGGRAVRGDGRGRGGDRGHPRRRRHRAQPALDRLCPGRPGAPGERRPRGAQADPGAQEAAPHSRRGQPHAWTCPRVTRPG